MAQSYWLIKKMLIEALNNTFIFNESALELINSSKVSIISTYFLLLINFVFLFYVIFKIIKLYKKKKINIFTSVIILGIFGSFTKFLGFSIYDEILIFLIILYYFVN